MDALNGSATPSVTSDSMELDAGDVEPNNLKFLDQYLDVLV
jgi:hypothetical protein